MIKVLLADDHPIFLDGMKAFLKEYEHIQIVGTATNGEEVLNTLETHPADIVVLDIDMPKLDGIDTTKYIKKKFPTTKVLIISMFDKKEFIIKLMKYGASGYILKNKTKEELLTAINNIADGKTHYSLEIINLAVSLNFSNDKEEVTLTDREVEVLKKIAEGHSSKEAGEILYISETTVNTHRRNIMAKLELPNTAQLVRYAIRNGYIKA